MLEMKSKKRRLFQLTLVMLCSLLCPNMTIWRCRPRFDYACSLRVKDMEIWMSQNMWCSQVLFFTIPHFHSFGFVRKKSGYDKKLNMLESLGKHNKNKFICTLQSSESLVSWKTSPPVMSIVHNAQATRANSDTCKGHLNIITP